MESDILRYGLRQSDKLTEISQNENLVEYRYEDLSDIEVLISDLQKKMPQNTIFNINIDITKIQIKSFELPAIKLTINEKILLIESSIYKIFNLSANNVFFDFIDNSTSKKKNKKLMVAVCERDHIDKWILLFSKYNLFLQFVGCIINEQQVINFLPWREARQRKHKFQLSIIAISYVGLMICLFFYLFIQAQSRLEIYTDKVSKHQIVEQQLLSKLSNHLPQPSPSQQQIHQFLLLLSSKLPSSIWLESFNYLPQKIVITGNSFTYPEITHFGHDLLSQIGVKNSQIQSVLINNNNLLFEMEIQLNVP